jgi:hypothetical protein
MTLLELRIQEHGKLLDTRQWPTVPRVGEIVVLHGRREFEVKEVLHLLYDTDGNAAKVVLEVVPTL